MSYIIGIVVVLGVLIFFHELGHFICAKAFGVGVEKFSLGFGPKILSKTIGMTEYRLSAIPLGGYVKMVGEQPDEEIDPKDIPLSFTHKSVGKRMLIVASGPFFNFFLAIIIFFGIFMIAGVVSLQPVIGEVATGSPAEAAGLLRGDRILEVNQTSIESWSDMAGLIVASKGRPLTFHCLRDNHDIAVLITPAKEVTKDIFNEEQDRYIIGVTAIGDITINRLGVVEAFRESLSRTYFICEITIKSVVKVLQGNISPKNIGGPIFIAQVAGEQVQQGMISLLLFIALISVNLGILNLLPVPVLDGGHLLFFGIEAITRRPVSIKIREVSQQAGIFLLMMLMVFVFYNDIMRFFAE
ncbi:MAG: RIP metalloprotease RseP [Dissulfuribacterales bacterium]